MYYLFLHNLFPLGVYNAFSCLFWNRERTTVYLEKNGFLFIVNESDREPPPPSDLWKKEQPVVSPLFPRKKELEGLSEKKNREIPEKKNMMSHDIDYGPRISEIYEYGLPN